MSTATYGQTENISNLRTPCSQLADGTLQMPKKSNEINRYKVDKVHETSTWLCLTLLVLRTAFAVCFVLNMVGKDSKFTPSLGAPSGLRWLWFLHWVSSPGSF